MSFVSAYVRWSKPSVLGGEIPARLGSPVASNVSEAAVIYAEIVVTSEVVSSSLHEVTALDLHLPPQVSV